MTDITIDRLFHEDRFSNTGWKVLILLLYSPVGILIAMIRMCMVFQVYAAATLLRSHVSVRRVILRIVCYVLGIIIEEDKSECEKDTSCRILVSNHSSIFDYIPIHILTNCETLVYSNAPDWLLRGIGLKSISVTKSNATDQARLTIFRSELKSHKEAILLFPENERTSGQVGLLKFNSWWVSEIDSVQPITLLMKRPSLVDIKPSVLGSATYSDYFWSFFVPYTIYTVKYLPVVEKSNYESNEAFAERLQEIIADKLRIAKTNFTATDKMEFEKRYMKDKNRSFILNQQSMIMRHHRDLQKMVIQVSEVFPNTSRDAIFHDLEVTGNVDVTITNILEGKVSSAPESDYLSASQVMAGPSSGSNSQSSSRFGNQHIMSLEERKVKLIEDARRRYKEKHNLS